VIVRSSKLGKKRSNAVKTRVDSSNIQVLLLESLLNNGRRRGLTLLLLAFSSKNLSLNNLTKMISLFF